MKNFIKFLFSAIILGWIVGCIGLAINSKVMGQAVIQPTTNTIEAKLSISLPDLTNSIKKSIVEKLEKQRVKDQKQELRTQLSFNQGLVEILSGNQDGNSRLVYPYPYKVSKAIDYANEKNPNLIQNFIQWRYHVAYISVIQWLLIGMTLIFVCRYISKRILMANSYIDDVIEFFGTLVYVLVFIGGTFALIFGCISNLKEMSKINTQPRTYMMETVTRWANDNTRKLDE